MNSPIKILLVEDNAIDALLIKKVLNESSYGNSTLFVTQSMADAVKFSKEDILLVLLDLKLPDSDGLNSIKHICKYFPDSALIVLTHLEDEEVAVETLKEGAQNYLNKKELNINVLDRAIRYSLERHRIIQKLRKTERQLVQSNFFLEKAQEVAHMGSWMADLINGTVLLSDEAQRIFGFVPGEFDNKQATFFSMIHPEDVQLLNKKIHESVAKKIIFKLTHRITRKDGVERWVNSAAEIVSDDKGIPYNMIGSVQDITEAKAVEKKINKTNRMYAFISQVNENIVRVKDEESLFRNACNIALEFGKFKMAWIGILDNVNKTITIDAHSGIPLEDIRLFENTTYQANGPQDYIVRTGTYYLCNDVEHDLRLESWKPFAASHGICSCIVLPIKKTGKIIGSFNLYSTELNFFDLEEIKLLEEVAGDISFALDLFENTKIHKDTEALIVKNEQRFRAIIENSNDMKALSTKEGLLFYGSPALTKVLGYSREELLKLYVTDIIHPEYVAEFIANANIILQTPGKLFYFEQPRKHKNGHWVWCEGSLTNMLLEPGVNAMVSNFRDISEKKLMEQQKDFDKNNLDALINNTSDLMWSVDTDFKLITFNEPFDNIIRLMSGKGLVKGNNILSVSFSPQQLTRYAKFYERAFAGETFTEIEFNISPVEFWSEISFYPILKGNEIVGTACHSRDITERKKAETEREKMTSDIVQRNKNLEQFSYIVSHNLRSPVANIMGLSAAAQYENISVNQRIEIMEGLSHSATKLDEVIMDLNNILDVKRDIGQKKEKVYFSQLANDIHSSIEIIIEKEKATLIWDFSEVNEITTVKSYLHSIFFNLISNSLKYHQPGVPPVIEIKSRALENKIELIFKDNGLGINLEKKRDQVFGLYKRFHSGNFEGKGIGLHMVKTQVESLGGKISIESKVNQGTTFKIEFEL